MGDQVSKPHLPAHPLTDYPRLACHHATWPPAQHMTHERPMKTLDLPRKCPTTTNNHSMATELRPKDTPTKTQRSTQCATWYVASTAQYSHAITWPTNRITESTPRHDPSLGSHHETENGRENPASPHLPLAQCSRRE